MSNTTNFAHQPKLEEIIRAVNSTVLGYQEQVEMMVLALLADGHVSAIGDPGTGKTMSMKVLAHVLADARYKRVQMLPDTMPSDIVGSEVKLGDTEKFVFVPGPLNAEVNLFHADEINRTPPRTQAALLEGMEERQVSVAGYTSTTFKMSDVFMVLATQNSLESDGVYPLPDAQLDRFAVQLPFPKLPREIELQVLKATARSRHSLGKAPGGIASLDDIRAMRQEVEEGVHCSDDAYTYAHDLCYATHPDSCPVELRGVFKTGVSVRASQWVVRLSMARAYLHGRSFVLPEDIKFVAPHVLRHRIYIHEEKEIKGMTPDKAIAVILNSVAPTRTS